MDQPTEDPWPLSAFSPTGAEGPTPASGEMAARTPDDTDPAHIAQRSAERLAVLSTIGQALASTPSQEALYVLICRQASRVLKVDAFYIALWDETQGLLTFPFHYDGSESQTPSSYPLGRGPTSRVIRTHQPFVVNSPGDPIQEGETFFGDEDRPSKSAMHVPMLAGDRIIGVISAQSYEENAYGPEDLQVLELIASQAAIAVENARLYTSAQRELAERRRAEEALRHYAAELEARNEELDAFAHTVAHDLKNPLASVFGYADLLRENGAMMAEQERLDCLLAIAQSARKMNRIIEELLLLSSTRDRHAPSRPIFDMGSVVAEALARVSSLADEAGAHISHTDNWPVVRGYGPWIEEVWTNYLSNAVKYGGEPPVVEVGWSQQGDGMVCFWVRDNGAGLAPEAQSRLFTPFTRLDQARAKGHGLGLSIVRRIVERLGGRVGVESAPGRGSLFFFTLPIVPQDES
jgi:signal transduction histidine kinase